MLFSQVEKHPPEHTALQKFTAKGLSGLSKLKVATIDKSQKMLYSILINISEGNKMEVEVVNHSKPKTEVADKKL